MEFIFAQLILVGLIGVQGRPIQMPNTVQDYVQNPLSLYQWFLTKDEFPQSTPSNI